MYGLFTHSILLNFGKTRINSYSFKLACNLKNAEKYYLSNTPN